MATITDNIARNLTAWMASTPSLDTLKKVSNRSKVGFGTIQRIKNGDGNPTITSLCDIARAFGRSIEDLLAPPNGTQGAAYSLREPPAPNYYPDTTEILGYLHDLDQPDAEIFIQELKLAALKARRKRQDERPSPASKQTKQVPEGG